MTYADELIVDTRCGLTFKASRRTFAHIDFTIDRLARNSTAVLHIVQGCYHDGPLSAGTHDFDAVLDFTISGLSWPDGQRFLRECGWAAWWRHTGTWAATSSWHFHAISLGYTTQVGTFVPGQVEDYYHHALGLKGQHDFGEDTSYFPPDIAATIFDYEEYAPMSPDDKAWLSDLIDAKLAANNTTLVKAVWDAAVDKSGTVARAALRKAAEVVK